MKEGWIIRQIEAGRKDHDIIKSLVEDGWTEADAKTAVISARAPPTIEKLPPAHINLFISAMIGLFILLIAMPTILSNAIELPDYANMSLAQVLTDTIFPSALIIAAIVLLIATLYNLAIKHHHPKLHALFCLAIASATAAGIVAWFLVGIRILIGPSTYISTMITIMSIGFGLYFITFELVYSTLRRVFDKKEQHLGRIFFVAAIATIVSFALLAGVAYYAEQKIAGFAEDKIEKIETIDGYINTELDAAKQEVSNIPNEYLREKILIEIQSIREMKSTSYARKGFTQDFFNDRLLTSYIDNTMTHGLKVTRIKQAIEVGTHYAEFKMQYSVNDTNVSEEAIALYNNLSRDDLLREIYGPTEIENTIDHAYLAFPLFRPSLLDKNTKNAKRIINSNYPLASFVGSNTVFPQYPDLNDEDQVEMIRFRIWAYYRLKEVR
jgi:hypothetical protein